MDLPQTKAGKELGHLGGYRTNLSPRRFREASDR